MGPSTIFVYMSHNRVDACHGVCAWATAGADGPRILGCVVGAAALPAVPATNVVVVCNTLTIMTERLHSGACKHMHCIIVIVLPPRLQACKHCNPFAPVGHLFTHCWCRLPVMALVLSLGTTPLPSMCKCQCKLIMSYCILLAWVHVQHQLLM